MFFQLLRNLHDKMYDFRFMIYYPFIRRESNCLLIQRLAHQRKHQSKCRYQHDNAANNAIQHPDAA